MTQQFSKLNKIGNTFKSNRINKKANFTIGQKAKNETSSDSDEDYENSIFQPNDISVQRGTSHYVTDSSCDRSIETGLEATEDNLVSSPVDTFLPGVGNYFWFVFTIIRLVFCVKKCNFLFSSDFVTTFLGILRECMRYHIKVLKLFCQ